MRETKQANTVYQHVRRSIEAGRFRIGERIPTERELASKFNLSRPTVSRAIRRLVAEGIISRNGKAGSIVIAAPSRGTLTFGAILMGLSRHNEEESPFGAMGNEILYQARMDNAVVLLHDPTWWDDRTDAGVMRRYSDIAGNLISLGVDGVFLMPQEIMPEQSVSASSAVVNDFLESKIPIVLLDRDIVRFPTRSKLDLVGIDNFGAGFTLTEHLVKFGSRKIDFLAHATRVPSQESRIAGYLRALEYYGIKADPDGVHHGNLFDKEFVISTLRRRRPDAIVVVSDSRAAPVMRFAIESGIRIPEKLRIGSFDDLPSSAHLPVPLTTMRQPASGLGYQAYRTMIQRMEEPKMPPVRLELTCELVIRASSGSAPRPATR